MRVLDLFSGIGGFSLGLERAGMETIAFCEIDKFCQKVLKKHWPSIPIHEDIKELEGEKFRGAVDLICGGYPCQPVSVAGKRRGEEDDRYLWPEYLRIIREVQPRWIIGENVAGHINMGLDDVLSDLEGEDYTWETFVIPACSIDAPHRRDRVWIVANSNSQRRGAKQECEQRSSSSPFSGNDGQEKFMANSKSKHDRRCFSRKRKGSKSKFGKSCLFGGRNWLPEPGICRVVNGLPNRMDRIRGLGNSVVPQIPEIIGRSILEIEENLNDRSWADGS